MFNQKFFKISFVALVLVAVFDYIGIYYNFYWIYKWYDIPMHMLGGFCVSLFFLSLYFYFNKRVSSFYKLLLVLLFITVSWEIFELAIKVTFLSDGYLYWLDTIKDIADGFIGGIVGYYLFKKYNKEIK